MRLIDADRFLSQIEDQYMEHDITREKYIDLEDRIAQQPTVEERKKGKWDDIGGIIRWGCPICHYAYETKYNFCPNCGADNRGEEDVNSDM